MEAGPIEAVEAGGGKPGEAWGSLGKPGEAWGSLGPADSHASPPH